MILQSLRELALREGLVDDPAFESKPVRWVIELDEDGHFLGVLDTNSPAHQEEGSKKKPRLEATLMVIPRRVVGRTSGVLPDFLVDNAKYVLGIAVDPAALVDPKNAKRHAAYLAMLKAAPQEIAELKAVLAFLTNENDCAACIASLVRQKSFAENDLFTFRVDGELIQNCEALRVYWHSIQDKKLSKIGALQCIVCGEQRLPVKLHNKIELQGAPEPVPFVSFQKEAFRKYGWKEKERNAPICKACMTSYVEALRRLTRARYKNPRKPQILSALSTLLTDDTTAIYWADNDDSFPGLINSFRDDPQSVKKLLSSPHKGSEYRVSNAARFYCLILTGVKGRIIVRRLHTGTVAEIERNLGRYFAAIHVAGLEQDAPIPLYALLKSMVRDDSREKKLKLPAELGTELWLSALFALPLSRQFLSAVVTRIRVEPQELKQKKEKVGRERAALIQLYFGSHGRDPGTGNNVRETNGVEEAPAMGLNENSTDRAYLLGRVLATAERMQMLAQQQGLNRTLVDRYYGMASVRPKVVFNELMKLYGYHKRKAMRDIPPLARSTDAMWGKLLFNLNVNPDDPKDDAFALSLTLEEQGRFGLGYYHQRQKFLNDALKAKEERERRAAANAAAITEDPTSSTEETAA